MSVGTPPTGAGTTVVLGTKAVKGLAVTGTLLGKTLVFAAAGALSLVAGVVTLGAGRRVRVGEPFES